VQLQLQVDDLFVTEDSAARTMTTPWEAFHASITTLREDRDR
jgi:hypothetical protein